MNYSSEAFIVKMLQKALGGRILRLGLGRLRVGLKTSEVRPEMLNFPPCRHLLNNTTAMSGAHQSPRSHLLQSLRPQPHTLSHYMPSRRCISGRNHLEHPEHAAVLRLHALVGLVEDLRLLLDERRRLPSLLVEPVARLQLPFTE